MANQPSVETFPTQGEETSVTELAARRGQKTKDALSQAITYCRGFDQGQETIQPSLARFFADLDSGSTIFWKAGSLDWFKRGCILAHQFKLASGNPVVPSDQDYLASYRELAAFCTSDHDFAALWGYLSPFVEQNETLADIICDYAGDNSAEAICGAAITEYAWEQVQLGDTSSVQSGLAD